MAGAAPILKVPVDDAAFKRFLDTFQKYQTALKEQPEMWKGMSTGVDAVVVAAAVMTEEIVRQTEKTKTLTEEEEKRERAAEAAARRRKKEQDDEEHHEKRGHDARKRQIDQVREYGRAVSNTVSGFGKWAAGGGNIGGAVGGVGSLLSDAAGGSSILAGLGGLLGAGGAFLGGSYLLAQSGGNMRRQAQGLNTSSGNLQGYENNLQRYFDVDSTFSKMAAMQNDPASLSMFGMMGITNPKGKDTAELVKESALAARRMWIASGKNKAIMDAQGVTQAYGVEDLNRLAANSPKDIAKSFSDAEKFAKDSGASDNALKKVQDFAVAVDNATSKLKNVLIDGLSQLAPSMTETTKQFGQLADDLKQIVDFADAGDKNLTQSLPGGEGWQAFWDKLYGHGDGSGAQKDYIRWRGHGGNVSGTGGAAAGGSNLFSALTGGFSSMSGGGSSGGQGDDVYSYFRQKGWSDSAARGIAAGVFAESGSKHDRFNEGGSGAYGLAQWLTKSRLADFKHSYGHDIYHSTRAEQLAFIDKELRSTESFAGSKIGNAGSAYEALQAFIHHYERPGVGTRGDLKRGKHYIERHASIKITNHTGANVAATVNATAG